MGFKGPIGMDLFEDSPANRLDIQMHLCFMLQLNFVVSVVFGKSPSKHELAFQLKSNFRLEMKNCRVV